MAENSSVTDFKLETPEATRFFVRKWEPVDRKPKALILVVHGAAEHSARYDRLARFLNEGGYAVFAPDHRGHGFTVESQDNLGWAGPDGWNGMVRDLHQLVGHIKAVYPGLPLFMLGHSMGSFLAQNYIQLYDSDLQGVILTGSTGTLGDSGTLIPTLEAAAQGEAASQPSVAFGQMFAGFNDPFPQKTGFEWLSRDEAEVQKYVDDPYSGFVFSNLLTADFTKGTHALWQPGKESTIPKNLPLLIASGEMDPVGGPDLAGLKTLVERYRQAGIKDIDFIVYPGARHEILNETNRDEVQQDILNWLEKHLPAGS
ncbi:MAG TPA: alpha/beta hydrolase [Chloroflexia bacterium]|nr:alpha/beta hydrolase [Chloroflexia bacterium]